MAGSVSKVHVDDNGRVCTNCGQYKNWNQFNKKKKGCRGHLNLCKECGRKQQSKLYCPKKKRERDLKKIYGITMEQYEEMLAAQHYGCKICGISPEEHGKSLVVDHCHNTRKVRGLLCNHCNIGIGHLKEDLGNFRKAMQYLSAAKSGLHEPGGLEHFAD